MLKALIRSTENLIVCGWRFLSSYILAFIFLYVQVHLSVSIFCRFKKTNYFFLNLEIHMKKNFWWHIESKISLINIKKYLVWNKSNFIDFWSLIPNPSSISDWFFLVGLYNVFLFWHFKHFSFLRNSYTRRKHIPILFYSYVFSDAEFNGYLTPF